MTTQREISVYEAAGGMPFFEQLVSRFYDGVEGDPILRTVYPEADLSGARHRLTLFLAQYWGGPTTYNNERGHPRLRMRHFPFAIGPVERDQWLVHMRAAIDASSPPPEVAEQLRQYFDVAAEAMRNREVSLDDVGEQLAGWGRVAIVETRGRRSGRAIRVAVGYLEDPGDLGSILVAAGSPDADWASNLEAEPACRVTIGEKTWDAIAEPLSGDLASAVVRDLILRYGTPAEGLGRGPAFRLRRAGDAWVVDRAPLDK